jgi:8-oxo-dGTP diphosphatase
VDGATQALAGPRIGTDTIRVAANAVIVRDRRVLLVEFDGGTPTAHFNFPGGGVDLGETLEEAVRREVWEETCLEVNVERLLLVVESVGARNTNLIGGERVRWNEVRFFFLCRPVDPDQEPQQPRQPDGNQSNVVWVGIDQLGHQPLLPQVSHELVAAMATPAGRPLVVANPHP